MPGSESIEALGGDNGVVTLILSALTPTYVLQVCDRRLTNATTGKPVDDEATKAVLWNNHMAFGYTGLAELMRPPIVATTRGEGLGRRPTNMWLAELLSLASSPDEAAALLSREASKAVARFALRPERRGLAFIGVGWTNHQDDPTLRPTLIEVSNLYDGHFGGGVRQLDGAGALVVASRPELERLVKDVQRDIESDLEDPSAAAAILTAAVRSVAAKDRTVGTDVLQTCLPRTQVQMMLDTGDCYLGKGPPALDHVSFRYVGSAGDEMIRSPTVVLGGLVAAKMDVGDGRAGALHVHLGTAPTDFPGSDGATAGWNLGDPGIR